MDSITQTMANPSNDKWYRTGLAFHCRQCGQCCAGPEEGYVWANADEIKAIAAFLNMTPEQLKKKFLRRVGLRYSLIEKQPGKDCIFLQRKKDNTIGCEIYPVRPIQCRTWPFWTENLRSINTWRLTGQRCPGLDQDFWTDFEQIENIRRGNLDNRRPPMPLAQAAWHWIINNSNAAPCLAAMEELYQHLDTRIASAGGQCDNCTQCCHFESFGHRLYVTTLEMLYAFHGRHKEKLNLTSVGQRCPFSLPTGCTLRDTRPAGCRIFFCKGLDKRFQEELTENTLSALRQLHIDFAAIYRYTDLLQWLRDYPNHS